MVDDVNLGGEPAVSDPFEDVEDGQPEEPVFKDVSGGPEEERLGGIDPEPDDVGMPEEPAEVEEAEESAADETVSVAEEVGQVGEALTTEEEAKPKSKSPQRTYRVFEQDSETTFTEQPSVEAHNADTALRIAFQELVGDEPTATRTLCVVPERFWRWQTVEARVTTDTTIEIR